MKAISCKRDLQKSLILLVIVFFCPACAGLMAPNNCVKKTSWRKIEVHSSSGPHEACLEWEHAAQPALTGGFGRIIADIWEIRDFIVWLHCLSRCPFDVSVLDSGLLGHSATPGWFKHAVILSESSVGFTETGGECAWRLLTNPSRPCLLVCEEEEICR